MRGFWRTIAGVCVMGVAVLAGGRWAGAGENAAVPATQGAQQPPEGKEFLQIKLPKPGKVGTPKNLPPGVNVNKAEIGKKRPGFVVPQGITNISAGKPVTSSAPEPMVGELAMLTDGDKEAAPGSAVPLAPGKQWVQIDLQGEYKLAAIVVWHCHSDDRIFRDVIVQASDDPDFIKDVVTLYNNDNDNSSGLGVGKDYEYIEDMQGRLIDGKSTQARYVRLWSKGSTADEQNWYTEVEVHGRSAK